MERGRQGGRGNIDDRGCLIPYSAGRRTLVKVGVVFDTDARTLGEWRTQTGKAPENINAA